MKISRESLTEFRKDFKAAMEPLEEKYDVSVFLNSISYNSDMFSSKLEVKNGRDPDVIASVDFDYNVWKYEHLGFHEGMYKRIFIGADGERYAVTGFNTRAKKRAILMTRVSDGKKLACPEGFVLMVTDDIYTENLADVVED